MLIVRGTKCHAMAVAMEKNVSAVQFDDFLASRGILYFKSYHQTTYPTWCGVQLVSPFTLRQY